LTGIVLILTTVQVEAATPRQEQHQISIKYTLTLSFRKERAYNYWWYSVLQNDKELQRQVATQLFKETRKVHPHALIHNITIQGYDDAIETRTYPFTDSSYFIRKTHLKGHSIQISFQISNILVALRNGLANVTIPLRGTRFEAKTMIAASAYYDYLMCSEFIEEEVEVAMSEVFDFHAFDRPFHSRFWKRKGNELWRFVREECSIWGVVNKRIVISCIEENIESSIVDCVGWNSVSFRSPTLLIKERSFSPRKHYLTVSLIGVLICVGSEDRRKRRAFSLIVTLTVILVVAYTPRLIEFVADQGTNRRGEVPWSEEEREDETTKPILNETFIIERTPTIFNTITRLEPCSHTTPIVRRELNTTYPFSVDSDEVETVPVFVESPSHYSDCEEGIDPEGMDFLCVARLTTTQIQEHRQSYTSTITPSFPTGYTMVSGKAWVRACSLATRSDIVLSERCAIGWTTETPWSIDNEFGNAHLRCQIPSTLTSAEYWSQKELEIPYYDPDTVESISLLFDEFRRKIEPGIFKGITGNSWSSYTEQPQCGSCGVNISLDSPHSGSFRFAWTCQRTEGHSGGVAYPLNYVVSNGDTILASWFVTRTGEAQNANYGDGANNWPMGCGSALIIIDEAGNERNLVLGQVNQDPRWGDSLGGTTGHGGSAQDIDVNELFQSNHGRSLEGCTILSFYLYGWVGHCGWSGVGSHAYLDVSFSNVQLNIRREASAKETIEIRSASDGNILASLVTHDSTDPAEESWERERSMDIPREKWGDLLGGTVKIALGVEYGGGDIDLLFDNLVVKITFNKAKFVYPGGSLIASDQGLHEMPGFNGGGITCLGADFDAEFQYLISEEMPTESHTMILYVHEAVSHSISLTVGYPSSPPTGITYSDYNVTINLPNTYSRINVIDPAGIDITSLSHISSYNSTHNRLVIGSDGFESSRYGTYRVTAESPNQVLRLSHSLAAWNQLEFSWECRDGEAVGDGEWTLYIHDPDGAEVSSQSGLIHETATYVSAGDWTLSEEAERGVYRAVLAWYNGTEGGGADVEFEVCSVRLDCRDLDGNPLSQATVQISRNGEMVREVFTDGSGLASQTLFPGRYEVGVRVNDILVGERSIDILTGEVFRVLQCSVCSPELRVLDGNGRPIVGALTSIILPTGSFETVLTDGYGEAQFLNIIAGEYGTSVLWRGMVVGNSTLNLQSSVTVTLLCNVQSLTVSICDREGKPLPYSTLMVDFPNGTERAIIADGYGKVEFDQVPGGTHRLRVYWEEEMVSDQTIDFSSSDPVIIYTTVKSERKETRGTTFIDPYWSGGGGGGSSKETYEDDYVFYTLRVEVVDGRGGAIQGAEVKIIDVETTHLISAMTTKADGSVRTLILTGTYRLEIQKGERKATRVVEIRSDRTIRIVLELEQEVEETASTIISAAIAILGSVVYLVYRRRSRA